MSEAELRNIEWTWTSEKEIRTTVRSKIKEEQSDAMDADRWIAFLIERMRSNGRLLTDLQLEDMRAKRFLRVGDYVRYIGPSRLDAVKEKQILRPTGQLGTISRVERIGEDPAASTYTFNPHISSEQLEGEVGGVNVALITNDWRQFERVRD